MKSKLAVVVSDLHCGSDVGLAPPEFTTRAGNKITIGENLHQAWLWLNWHHAIGWVQGVLDGADATLFINGDATEGVHHRNNEEIIAQKIDEHVSMAVTCLQPLLKHCSRRYVIAGTKCHTEHMEDLLAERIKADGRKAMDKRLVEIHGCLIDAAHHMGVTSRLHLEASLMSIQMSNARSNYLRSGQRVPQVFLRGHRHCGGHFSDMAGLWVVTGAWQFLTRHGHQVVTDSIPRPSVAILDWRGKKPGELPTIHEKKFDPPQHEISQS